MKLGELVMIATKLQPFLMGIIVSVLMGMILTLPISSAALGVILNLSGLAAGAATVGCCCNMVGFAVASYRENKVGGLLAQGIGTSMLQVPNIVKKPIIWLPTIIASAILGPISTTLLKMPNTSVGAGMGTCGFVGQFGAVEAMNNLGYEWYTILWQIGLLHFILPIILVFIINFVFEKLKLINSDDYLLNREQF